MKAGKAFLEHIDEDNGVPGQVVSYFIFHVLFRGQRFKSRPVACACEPDIDEGFLLELHKDSSGKYSHNRISALKISYSYRSRGGYWLKIFRSA